MRRKLRIFRMIATEIIIMSLGVLCCVMPLPWRLVVPIIIGARSILLRARARLKESPPELIEPQSNKIKDKKLNAEKKQRKVKKDDSSAEKTGGKKTARQGGSKKTDKAQKG